MVGNVESDIVLYTHGVANGKLGISDDGLLGGLYLLYICCLVFMYML